MSALSLRDAAPSRTGALVPLVVMAAGAAVTGNIVGAVFAAVWAAVVAVFWRRNWPVGVGPSEAADPSAPVGVAPVVMAPGPDCTCAKAQTHTGHPRTHVQLPDGTCDYLDAGVLPFVVALNTAGVPTAYSCQGGVIDGRLQPGNAVLGDYQSWYALLSTLYGQAGRMSEAEVALLWRMTGGATPRGWRQWQNQVDVMEAGTSGHRPAKPGEVPTAAHLVPRLVLQFPPADAALAANLITTYGLPGR